jgi:lipopolysaccharide transport system permease protein
VALTLAALGTYLRDLQHLVPLATTGLMFLSPVFYPQAAAPQALQAVLALNPLTAPIEAMRAAWFAQPLQTGFVLPQVLAALVALGLALALFRRLRPGFADLV